MGMRFQNSFTVAAPPDKAWAVLLDVSRIAPCVPGAELTEIVDPTHFKGRARVKIGPVELAFGGQAEFAEVDNINRKARLLAKGNDTKGRGNASAVIDFELVPDGTGSRVTAATDLTMTGAIAQYGRGIGIMNDVANHITEAFARNLQELLAQEGSAGSTGLASGRAVAPQATPISVFTLALAVFRRMAERLFAKLFGGARS
jgi:carbon monoxide dehydrogenase subunit G